MKRIDVVPKGGSWVAQTGAKKVVASAPKKVDAVKKTAKVAKADPKPVTVKIHKVDGKIQEERTYPSSADPRNRKGAPAHGSQAPLGG